VTAVPAPPPEPADRRPSAAAPPRPPRSHLSGTTAGLLQLFPAVILIGGVGRLYTGHTSLGVAQLVTGVVIGWGTIAAWLTTGYPGGFPTAVIALTVWVWYLVDALALIFGRPEDRDGRRLRP